MRGLQKMIDKEEYCVNILTQSLAIQKSLRSLDKLILENHLHTHVQSDLNSSSPQVKNRAVKEILDLYELSNVRNK
jgi:CsoR family transcriptional regulator, copper-sensing transcriptional repressor